VTVDRDEASALLNDVASIEARVRELLIYSRVSDYLILWGAIFFVGFTGTFFFRDAANTLWLFLEAIGGAATVGIVARRVMRNRAPALAVVSRAVFSVIGVLAFGTLWIWLAHMGWREQVTFWPTLLGFLLFMIGQWAGRALVIGGFVLFVATLSGYFLAGDYLHLWMAVAAGGSMIAGGLWLRRPA